jgi:hypothetical protein
MDTRIGVTIVFGLAVALVSTAASGDETALCAGKPGAASCAKIVEAEKQSEDRVQASIDFSFKGDRAPETRTADLSLGMNISKGAYPVEVKAKTRTTFKDRDGDTTEDVSEAAFSLDYFPRHDLQIFALGERFTDSFLSIDTRWEAGAGIEYEWNRRDDPDKRKTRTVLSEGTLHDILHPEEVDLTCEPSWKEGRPKKADGAGGKRAWYGLTPKGYERLEAWAWEYREAGRRMVKLEMLHDSLCKATDKKGRRDIGEEYLTLVRKREPIQPPDTNDSPQAIPEKLADSQACSERLGAVGAQILKSIEADFEAASQRRKSLKRDFCGKYGRSLEKRYSRWSLEASLATLWELESAVLKVKDDNLDEVAGFETSDDNGSTESFTIPGQNRARWSLRLATRYRITDQLTLRAQYFHKETLDSPERGFAPVVDPDDERGSDLFLRPVTATERVPDVRKDYVLELALAASDKISVKLEAVRRKDEVPPVAIFRFMEEDGATMAIPVPGIDAVDPEDDHVFLFARDRHWTYRLVVSAKL